MEELYDSSGVDVTLIRWSLSLTPEERLDMLDDFLNMVLQARRMNGTEWVPCGPADARYLLPHTELVEISADLRVRVLDLETQVAIKEECGREKDLAVHPVLRRTLAESRRLKQT